MKEKNDELIDSGLEDVEDGERKEGFFFYKRVKTPTIIQMEATECGAVSLAIILSYYHKYVPIEELRIVCNVTRDGNNAWNISQAAESYGLEVHGYSMELDQLPTVALPAIIFWEFEHFVVLEGFGKDCYYINDPATGPRSVTEEEFDHAFTGVLLELRPTEKFIPSGKPTKLFTLLFKQLKSVKPSILFIFLTQLGLLIPTLALAAISEVFIDQIFEKHEFKWVQEIFLSIGFTVLLTGILIFLQERVFIYLNAKLSLQIASRTLWHLFRLPFSFFVHRYPGEVAYRLNLIDSITNTLTGHLAFTFLDCILIFFYGIVIFYYSPEIALIAVAAGLVNLLLMQHVFRIRQDNLARYQSAIGKSTACSFGIIENIETIKSMALEKKYFSQWSGYNTKAANVLSEIGKKDIYLGIFPPFLNSMTFMALIAFGTWEVLNQKLTIGMFAALQILLINFMSPLMRLVNFSQVIQYLKVDLKRIDDLMEYPTDSEFQAKNETDSSVASKGYKKLEGYVELKDVTYGYSPLEPPLLDKINLKLQPGKTVALVGLTGCGKSTLAMLLTGLYHPWSGEVLYDGMPRGSYPRHQLTSSISFVEQSPFLFRGSVRDNITLYNPLLHQDEIIAAAKDACIHEEIMARKGGYELELTDNGLNLSGGQRQRLEIARGLVKNPSILVLDECTSTLDSEIEEEVIRNIHRRGSSILMIAHRLSSIKNCDEICIMDKGKIISRGTHEQLKRECIFYRELVKVEGNSE